MLIRQLYTVKEETPPNLDISSDMIFLIMSVRILGVARIFFSFLSLFDCYRFSLEGTTIL